MAEAFASVVDAKSPYTARHSEAVADIAVALATVLELGPEDRATMRRAALLHDIGKLGVPDAVLLKPGPLNEQEWKVMHSHDRMGVEIISGAEVVDICQDEDSVTIGVRGVGRVWQERAAYLVGCDGADSAVRRLAGIPFHGTTYEFGALLADVRLDRPPGHDMVKSSRITACDCCC